MLKRPATRRALSGAALVQLLVIICAVPWVGSQFADAAAGIVEPGVRQRVSREGAARVIAELRLPSGPHTAEGLLPSPAAVAVQRSDIATARRQLLARLASRSHRVVHQYDSVPFVALEIGPDALFELEAASFLVRRVVEDTLNAPTLPQSVPLTGADRAWSRGFDGTDTVVAIVDTGVEATHPFLAGKVVEEACYSSTNASSTSVCPNGQMQQVGPGSGTPCSLSGCWHGTHVAGIAAGAGTSFSGMAKGAQIMAVQVFSQFNRSSDCGGSPPCTRAWTSDIIAGLERVYALRGARNIAAANLSLGGGTYATACDTDPTKAIIDNLRAAGIATIVAAGNGSSVTSMSAPACISTAVSVGATTKADVVASFSNMSGLTSLLAPGESIQSSVTGGGFGVASGTSMATPHVTGAWAILKEAAPNATVSEILSTLQTTGLAITDSRSGNPATYVTKPRIRVDQAVAAFVPVSQASEIVIDNGAAGTSATGTWCTSSASDFFGTDSLYSCGGGVDTYRWTPTFAAANTYDVYVWWSTHVNRSSAVPVTVVHAAGSTTQTFNEQAGGGRWVLHGRYSFNAGTAGYVQVSSANGQAAADAVRWVPVQ